MMPLVYNVSLSASVCLIGLGVGLQFGLAQALMAVGGLVLVLTVFGARLAGSR